MTREDAKKLYDKYSYRLTYDSPEEYQSVVDQFQSEINGLLGTCISCKHLKKEHNSYYCTDANHPTPASVFPDKYGCIYFVRIDNESQDIKDIWRRLEVVCEMVNKLWQDSKHS
jgi:hypothetical protein